MKSISRAIAVILLLATMAVCPPSAEAHLNSTGLGPVYDGFLHFLLSPADTFLFWHSPFLLGNGVQPTDEGLSSRSH
jgi:hypothetical protein